jgi:hypothetical protein
MPKLDPAIPLAHSVPKLAQKYLDLAIDQLDEQRSGQETAIHQARRYLKRVRALLRLVEAADKKALSGLRHDLTEAAHRLSDVRDAAALVECTERLAPYLKGRQASDMAEPLHNAAKRRQELMAVEDTSTQAAVTKTIATCRKVIKEIDHCQFGRASAGKILAAARRENHTNAREALKLCHHGGEQRAFHELRKCAQITHFQAAFVRIAWPFAFDAEAGQAKKLAELLGEEHDIEVLNILLQVEPHLFGAIPDKDRLASLLNERRAALRHDAMGIAAALYEHSARMEAHRLSLLWSLAQKERK